MHRVYRDAASRQGGDEVAPIPLADALSPPAFSPPTTLLTSPSTPSNESSDGHVFAFDGATTAQVGGCRPGSVTPHPPQLSVDVLDNAAAAATSTTRREGRVRFSLAPEQILAPQPEDTDGGDDRCCDRDGAAYTSTCDVPRTAADAHLEPYSMITQTTGVRISWWTQVLALLQRTGRQYMRQKLTILVEVASPLLFVILLIILNVAFGSDPITETVFTKHRFYSSLLRDTFYTGRFCYNDSLRPIKGLRPCTALHVPHKCDGDESTIPVHGLCYYSGFTSPVGVVTEYVNSLMGAAIAVPTLDSLIVHQWMAKKAGLANDSRTRTALAALSNVGIGVSATTRFDSICYSGNLYFAPAAKVPPELIAYFGKRSDMFRYVYAGTYDTVADAQAAIAANESTGNALDSTWGLIVVNDITHGFDVEVQLNGAALPSMYPPVSMQFRGGYTYDGTDMYLASGFVTLQQTLYGYFYEHSSAAGTLAKVKSGAVAPYTHATIYPVIASFPTIASSTPYLLSIASSLVAFVMVLSLLYPFAQMTKRVVLEKELRIQESMCIMGLQRPSLWVNFLLVSFLEYALVSIILTVLLCAVVTPRSDPFAIFLILLVYCLTLIPLCGLVSTFFSHARMAALMSPLIYFVLAMPVFAMASANRGTVLGLSLLSPTALASLLTDVFTAEAGDGFSMAHFRNQYFTVEPYLVMIILACDCGLYLLLMFYLDAVLPQEWGTRKHPLFFILEPYAWLKRRVSGGSGGHSGGHSGHSSHGGGDGARETTPLSDDALLLQLQQSTGTTTNTATSLEAASMLVKSRSGAAVGRAPTPSTEPPSSLAFDPRAGRSSVTGAEKDVSVRVDRVCKYFTRNGKRFTAVDNVSWSMYRGEIAVLLGPNGAGKSTTINMITGMLTADSGDCFIEGFSMARNVAEARHEIGYCPQHNILWPDLTCREHLEFYGKIKGLRGAELEDAVLDILRAVDLEEKIDAIPTLMSGGQKRKLSVAIAFVGRNRVVLLDEPTAGMDAAARRHTWSLLRAMTQHHTILLTTHFMDEADLLGDNIAIVTEGVMQCAGSTAFLRRYAGVGYTLRFDLSPIPVQDGDDGGAARQARVAAVWANLHRLVTAHLPDSTLVLQTDAEVEYELRPSTEVRLPEFLKGMESHGNRQLHLRGYALRAPTLEDVFLRVVEHQVAPEAAAVQQEAREAPASERHGDGAAGAGDASRHAWVSEGPNVSASSPSVYRSMNRRMSRASLRFLNNESAHNYGNNALPSDGDEDPAAATGAAPQRDVSGASVVTWIGADGGGGVADGAAAGAYLAGAVANCNNASVTGLRRRQSAGISGAGGGGGEVAEPSVSFMHASTLRKPVAGDAPTLDAFDTRQRLLQEGASSAHRPRPVRTPLMRRPSVAKIVAQQQQLTDTSLSTHAACEVVPDAPAVVARVRRLDGAPSSPLSSMTLGNSAGPADVAGAPVVEDAAAGGEAFLYKHVTDRHLDQIWATRHTSQRWHLWGLQLRGMMYKRFFCAIRDRRMQFFQIVCPVFCILLAMLLQLVKSTSVQSLVLSPAAFDVESAMQVSGCARYMGSTAHMAAYGHNLSDVSFTDPNFITSADMSLELLDTWFTHSRSRFMSLQCNDVNIAMYLQLLNPALVGTKTVSTLLYNTSSRNSLPIAMHVASALAFFGALGSGGNASATTYTMTITALPLSKHSTASAGAIAGILIGVIVLIPFTFLPANPVAWVVKEYEARARHLQTASGLFYLVYWLGNFLFDFAAYVVSMVLVIIIFVIFQRHEYIGYDTIGATIVAFTIYGVCYCCCSYMVSFAFSEHTTAQIVVLGVSFLTGFLCVMLVFVLSLLDKTVTASNTLRWVFRVLPPYSIGEVILNLALLEQKRLTDPSLTAWSMSVTVWPDIYMAIEAPIFAAATLLWDHPNRRAVVARITSRWAARCCCRRRDSPRHRPRSTRQAGELPVQSDAASSLANGAAATVPVSAARGEAAATVLVASPRAQSEATATSPTLRRRGDTCSLTLSAVDASAAASVAETTLRAASMPPTIILPDIRHSQSTEEEQHEMISVAETCVCGSGYGLPAVLGAAASPGRGGVAGGLVRAVPVQVGPAWSPHDEADDGADDGAASVVPAPAAMVYPPPRWYKVDTLRLREEDSDVEEERRAVYETERRHVAEQEATASAASTTSPLARLRRRRSTAGDGGGDGERESHQPLSESTEACDVVRVVDLRKVYDAPRKVAVSALTFSVMHGEVFGFLGTNGAGKSSALSIITQEQMPTSGRAYVCGNDVVNESRRAAGCLGYCPQFDACIDLLTVTEHLRLYAMVRGVPVAQLDNLVASLLTICNLTQYRHVFSNELSGGNRRKLSVAIALIGAPRVVCLDEPTAGMDPLARQLLWRALDRVSRKCSIILTSHHLEEVEALADCVGIMVDGGLRCFGDLPHLKHKYARNAYELTLRVSPAVRQRARERREEQQRQQQQQQQQPAATAEAGVSPVSHPRRMNADGSPRQCSRRGDGASTSAVSRRMSASYAGNNLIDASDDIFQFMLRTFPSALLIDSFNNERYVYTLPATRDVAVAMQELLQQQQQQSQCSQAFVQTPSASAMCYAATPHASTKVAGGKLPPIVRLSDVFETLRAAQAELGITEYSVSQVSLEQVFLRICSAEDTQKRDRQRHRAVAAAQAGVSTAPAGVSTSGQAAPPSRPALSRRRSSSRASFTRRNSSYSAGGGSASPARRRLSVPAPDGVGATGGATRLTFAEYRRQRALWRLRAEAAAPRRTLSEQQRVTEPDNESPPQR
ncbi:ATP-binding cassette subfamily A, member 1 [Novymonas esmeraldas]|uniref:ATP-binding cassette subfamily A, member 1 n=1 Tax=Novymonas esmeraldas TaxID=1808958 RepID=A0AAW0ETN8_9TRYP